MLNAEMADVEHLAVTQTPTFFVNRKAPVSMDSRAVANLVASEVAEAE